MRWPPSHSIPGQWDKIGTIVLNAFNYATEHKILHLSACRGVISLIPKKDRDVLHLKNRRPLILLNMNYKILAKAIARRITPHLDKIIHSSQTGFMKNRNITHNIRILIDIMHYVDEEQVGTVVISLDFENAFDRVERQTVNAALKLLNFGEYLISLINLLYNEFHSCTINLEHTSEWFYPGHGLHQGCPASLIIFVCVIELLGQQIRDNKDIRGILIGYVEYKSIQFADNMNLFSLYIESSLRAAISTISIFEANTG